MGSFFRDNLIEQFRLWTAIIVALFCVSGTSFAVPITIEVGWPSWSSDNRITIRDPSGTALESFCDPFNCFNSATNSSYTDSFNRDYPVGTNYSIDMEDSWGDAWNGTSFVRIYADGVLVFENDGPATSFESGTFDVDFAGGGGGSVCAISSDKENNWASGSLTYSETNLGGIGLDMTVTAVGETGRLDTIVGGGFNGVNGLDLRTNGFFRLGYHFYL